MVRAIVQLLRFPLVFVERRPSRVEVRLDVGFMMALRTTTGRPLEPLQIPMPLRYIRRVTDQVGEQVAFDSNAAPCQLDAHGLDAARFRQRGELIDRPIEAKHGDGVTEQTKSEQKTQTNDNSPSQTLDLRFRCLVPFVSFATGYVAFGNCVFPATLYLSSQPSATHLVRWIRQ